MAESSRHKAQSWPYPRYREYEDHLHRAAENWFREKEYPVDNKYSYILDSLNNWRSNIILPEVANYIVEERARREKERLGFPLHKYAHHGLSSQAMVFNLIGPLIVDNDLEPLRCAIQAQGITWPGDAASARFEFEDRSIFNEDSGQPTSIDLVIQEKSGKPRLFIESKFVEQKFGGCSVFGKGDCDGRSPVGCLERCYLHYVGRRYWELLEQFGFLEGPLGSELLCPLAVHYQFFRELLFALQSGGVFVLLYDARNPTFFADGSAGTRGLVPLLLEFVPANLLDRVGAVSIQQVIAEIRSSGRHAWTSEFEKKYGLNERRFTC